MVAVETLLIFVLIFVLPAVNDGGHRDDGAAGALSGQMAEKLEEAAEAQVTESPPLRVDKQTERTPSDTKPMRACAL